MLILIDKKIPDTAKRNLALYGETVELETSGITYEAVSGHPDIFFFQSGMSLIAAPNLPEEYFRLFDEKGITLKKGLAQVERLYPSTALYNAAVSDSFFIHNLGITDRAVLEAASDKHAIDVKQGYCRCNLLALKNDSFITSDQGIHKTLSKEGVKLIFADPSEIILPGFSHGFFGGACGIYDDRVFITGNLNFINEGSRIRRFLNELDYKVIELYDGPLFDGGSIFFKG